MEDRDPALFSIPSRRPHPDEQADEGHAEKTDEEDRL
jgi:hypothetical protein